MFIRILVLLLAPQAALAGVTGVVLDVTAGDTFSVLVREDVLTVHLRDIDAPAPGAPFATRAQQSLEELCANKPVLLDDFSIEPQRHVTADATCDGVDAGTEQVRRGMAWVYQHTAAEDSPLHRIEHEARAGSRGIWSETTRPTANSSAE